LVVGYLKNLNLVEVVVGLLVSIGFEGFRLVVGLEDHIGERTTITIIAPPTGSEYGIKAMWAFARWRFAFESGFEPGPHAR
jgi:hypothetical protein